MTQFNPVEGMGLIKTRTIELKSPMDLRNKRLVKIKGIVLIWPEIDSIARNFVKWRESASLPRLSLHAGTLLTF